MADGGQQPGSKAVGLGELSARAASGQFLALPGAGGALGQGREQVPVLAEQLGPHATKLRPRAAGARRVGAPLVAAH